MNTLSSGSEIESASFPRVQKNSLVQPIVFGVCAFSFQLLWVLLSISILTAYHAKSMTLNFNFQTLWLSLANRWDAGWYAAIAHNGYQVSIDNLSQNSMEGTNASFFPGYPYSARLLLSLFPLSTKAALLIVSQTATLIFWCVIFYLMRFEKYKVQFYTAALLFCFPMSWMLVMGHAEPLFSLLALLTILFATKQYWARASILGFLLTGTRLFGVPMLLAPTLAHIVTNYSFILKSIKDKQFYKIITLLKNPIIFMLISVCGFLSFLLYTQVYFGAWNLYFIVEKIGWNVKPDIFLGFLFNIMNWIPHGVTQRFFTPLFFWISVYFGIKLLYKPNPKNIKSITFYFAAVLSGMASATASATQDFQSMVRFLLPVWPLLLLSDYYAVNHLFFFKKFKYKKYVITIIFILFAYFWFKTLNRYEF